ncbi:PP2C family protein-serine/threonine phosphatase [Streptomyces sp. NPDC048484]|uniref:PP2C family protein-serine/threonine phosphatase n=1 Tax=Streptomyces sp. NPDC048484 TaxID=3155146 RepID=UPI00341FB127
MHSGHRRWTLAVYGVGLLLTVVDLATGRHTSLVGTLLMCPLLAATRLNGRSTALCAGYALLAALAVAGYEQGPASLHSPDAQARLTVVALAGGTAVVTARRLTTVQHQLAAVAVSAQRAILRPLTFSADGLWVCARSRSAAPLAEIGGDLYAFAQTPAGLRLIIGDVRGKGLEAVRLSAAAIGHFRDQAYTAPDLATLTARLDKCLAGDLGPEDFITAVLVEITPKRLTLANCGHHAPLLLPAAGTPVLLEPAEPSTPLGLSPQPLLQQVPLTEADRVLFYTDGLVEARDRTGSMFALSDLTQPCSLPFLGDAVETVLHLVERRTEGRAGDDIALILIESSA